MGLTKSGWLCVAGIVVTIAALTAARALAPTRAGKALPVPGSHAHASEAPLVGPSTPPFGIAELESSAAEIEGRLRDQPDVQGAAVKLEIDRELLAGRDGRSLLDIYIQWHCPTPPPERRLKTVADWAACAFDGVPALEVQVRDSAGRHYRMNSQE